MTAINVVRLAESVHLFCDSMGSWGGAMLGHAVKCLPLPHLNVAIAARGPAIAIYGLIRMATGYRDFDHLRSQFASDLQYSTNDGRLSQYDAEALAHDLDIFVIGMGKNGPGAFLFFNHDLHGAASWEVHDIPYVVVTPTIPAEQFHALTNHRQPLEAIPAIMRAQCKLHPGTVGGTICETIVSAIGIGVRTHGNLVREAPQAHAWTSAPVQLPQAFARHLVHD
jgi:hypothetical protein